LLVVWTGYWSEWDVYLISTCFLSCKQISDTAYLRVVKPLHTDKEHALLFACVRSVAASMRARHRPCYVSPGSLQTVSLWMNPQISRISSVTVGSFRRSS